MPLSPQRPISLVFALTVALTACGQERLAPPTPYHPEGASSAGGGNTGSDDGGASSGTDSGTSSGLGASNAGATSGLGASSGTGSSSGSSAGAGGSSDGGSSSGSTGTVPFDPRTWQPGARGLWIWRFDYLNMTAEQAAQRAQALGVSYVLIKSGQDGDFWSTRYTPAAVASFTSRGMHVFAWPYITPANVTAAAAAAVQAAQVPGTDGVVLDVEVEFDKTASADHSAAAAQLCDAIRAGAPKVFLGYTSFGWVGYHSDFPYAAFDKHCGDAFFPQVYWSDFGTTWLNGYNVAVSGIAAAKLTAPVWMVQSNDSGKNGVPVPADLNSFFAKAGPRTSLWAFTAATTSQYAELPKLAWTNGGVTLDTWPPPFRESAPHFATTPAVDFSSAEATFATQLALLRTHPVDTDLLALFTQSVTSDVPLSESALAACAARVKDAAIAPDWEMAQRNEGEVRVSLFGKSLTSFVADSAGSFRATSLWCTPHY